MAVGDSATGVVRNLLFKRRTKHWVGNIAMAAVSVPIGWYYLGVAGALAGLLASAVERFEFPRSTT
jgi:phytol kinase